MRQSFVQQWTVENGHKGNLRVSKYARSVVPYRREPRRNERVELRDVASEVAAKLRSCCINSINCRLQSESWQ